MKMKVKKQILSLVVFLSFCIKGQDPVDQVRGEVREESIESAKVVEVPKKRMQRPVKHVKQMPSVAQPPREKTEDKIADMEKFTHEFNAAEREKATRALFDRGVAFCATNGLVDVCQAFTHTKDFIEGELYLFLINLKGVVYAHGDQAELLWKNLYNTQDMFGAFIVQEIIKNAQKGPGWVTYEWNGSVKNSYVQKVVIENKEYIIGCGYYPQSKKYAAIGLVKGAVATFNKDIAAGADVDKPFGSMTYSLTKQFIFGDLYLFALDFEGKIWAQGDRPGLVGKSGFEDNERKDINKGIIDKLKDKKEGEGVWVEYTSKNAKKLTYAEKVKDKNGKYYFIACGYYPEVDRDKTRDLVNRGYTFMKASGVSVAVKEFSDPKINTYRFGDLALFVYDMKGNVIANGYDPESVGENQFDLKNENGRYMIREMIDLARAGGGWVEFKLYNSFQATYVKMVDMGVEQYLIGSGLFPVSKPDTMTLLVKSAVSYLMTHSLEDSCEKFTDLKGTFSHGDLFIYMFDAKGFCYAWSDSYKLIWQDLSDWKDDTGKFFITDMITDAAHGPDSIVITLNNHQRVNYFEQVEKDGNRYIVGSGFYK